RKYKPVALKVRPVKTTLPEEFRILRKIEGDPLAGMPEMPLDPPEFTPKGRYTQERKEIIDQNHSEDFLTATEKRMLHWIMGEYNDAFAWTPEEAGNFREDFFPSVVLPVIPHTPWVLKNIPIPPGIFDEVCKLIKAKIDNGTY
ncbi:hypothetical protein K435DRAFT_581269, partial [Dendrothele bispora CBS 962.96]